MISPLKAFPEVTVSLGSSHRLNDPRDVDQLHLSSIPTASGINHDFQAVFSNNRFFHRHSGASANVLCVNCARLAWRFPPCMATIA